MASFKENIREILYNDTRNAGLGVAVFDQFLEFDAVVGSFVNSGMMQPSEGASRSIVSAGPSSPPPLPELASQPVAQQSIDLPPLPLSVTPQSIVPDSTELQRSVMPSESLPPLPSAPAIASDAGAQLPPSTSPSPPTPVAPTELPETQRVTQAAADLPSSPETKSQSAPMSLPDLSSLPRRTTSEVDFPPGSPAMSAVENPIEMSPSPPPAVQPAAPVAPPPPITESLPPSPVTLPPQAIQPVAFNDPPPANAPSPPPVAVPVATAQAPPLPDFTPSATEDRRESEDEGEFDDVAEVIRQHRSPDLPPLSRFQEKRRQYGGSTASDPYGAKEHVEQQQIEQASTQSVIDAVVAAQADIANRRNRQDTATLEIMERTAYRQADHERRLREINAASQRSVSTLTDQYVL
jgi:hypothetical protein